MARLAQPELSMPTSRRRSRFAAADQHRAASPVEVELTESKRLVDAQPGPPVHGDQPARSFAVEAAAAARDRDDLLAARLVGRVPASLAARSAFCEVAGHSGR
jgi:hypothetical protein